MLKFQLEKFHTRVIVWANEDYVRFHAFFPSGYQELRRLDGIGYNESVNTVIKWLADYINGDSDDYLGVKKAYYVDTKSKKTNTN